MRGKERWRGRGGSFFRAMSYPSMVMMMERSILVTKLRPPTEALFIIDPQNDFVTGSLKVTGAEEDMVRIAGYIKDNIDTIDHIVVSKDNHSLYHIGHPKFWMRKDGKATDNPPDFTALTLGEDNKITSKGVEYVPVNADTLVNPFKTTKRAVKTWVREYLKALQDKGRTHMIWPEHCIKETLGRDVDERVQDALNKWEDSRNRKVTIVEKGECDYAEMYSALKAEVECPWDERTHLNTGLLDSLWKYDTVSVCGEAKSHCVKATTEDMVEYFEDMRNKESCAGSGPTVVIYENAMSNVTGGESEGEKFIQDMRTKKRVQIKKIIKKMEPCQGPSVKDCLRWQADPNDCLGPCLASASDAAPLLPWNPRPLQL